MCVCVPTTSLPQEEKVCLKLSLFPPSLLPSLFLPPSPLPPSTLPLTVVFQLLTSASFPSLLPSSSRSISLLRLPTPYFFILFFLSSLCLLSLSLSQTLYFCILVSNVTFSFYNDRSTFKLSMIVPGLTKECIERNSLMCEPLLISCQKSPFLPYLQAPTFLSGFKYSFPSWLQTFFSLVTSNLLSLLGFKPSFT